MRAWRRHLLPRLSPTKENGHEERDRRAPAAHEALPATGGPWLRAAQVHRDVVLRHRRGRDSNGKRIQETKGGFLTKQDAREARAARMTTLSTRTADAHALTVGDFLEQWLEGKRKLRPSTLASYREYIDGVFKPHIGSLRLVELERHPEHLDRMFTALAKPRENGRRLAVGTIHRMYGTLRAALNVAVRRRLITFNPALTIELEELPRPRIVV